LPFNHCNSKELTDRRPYRRDNISNIDIMKRRLTSLLTTVAIGVSSIAIGESSEVTKVITSPQHKQSHLRSSNNNLRRSPSTTNNNNNINNNKRRLGTDSYCGNNWQTAHDTCTACSLDEDCGPGNYCFHYISCTPPSNNDGGSSNNNEPVPAPSLYQPMSAQVPSGAVSGKYLYYIFFGSTSFLQTR